MTTSPSGFCAECGARHVSGANYCRECGTLVPAGPKDSYETSGSTEPEQYGYQHSTISSSSSAVPGEQAGMGTRTGSWLINNVAIKAIGMIPVIGWIVPLGAFIWMLFLFQRGQDVGARLLGLRVVRDTGEIAGFYHMWTRGLASIISFLAIGAGFWTAYSDPDNQTWHDKWMGTYVVKTGPEVDDLPGTSSSTANVVFWVSIIGGIVFMLLILLVVLIAVSDVA